jgi:hypothetical protein
VIYQGTTPLPTSPEDWATLTEDEQKAIYAQYAEVNRTPCVSPGLPLGLPENAKTVQVEDGRALVTDGPYVTVKEAVGGFIVFEADSIDAAVERASRIPAALHGGAVEVRPVERYG